VLLQIRGNAEALNSIVTALSQILGCPCSKLIHPLIQQRRNKHTNFAILSQMVADIHVIDRALWRSHYVTCFLATFAELAALQHRCR
jgi:hypothetical protein